MKKFIRITFLITFCFLSIQFLSAQARKGYQGQTYEKIDTIIEKINRLLESNCKLEFNEELIIVFYEKGVIYREDRVYLDALDPNNVRYISEENAVVVQCLKFKGLQGKLRKRLGEGCIGREFFKDKKKLTYSRIAFQIENEKSADELQLELINLIRSGHELTFE